MTRDTLQFVDAISASPTVLLDLHNDSPFYMARDGWSAPPPRLNRAATSSTSRDGSNVSQSAYADRELVITVGLNTVSQDQAAEAIQALARLLNSDGQWLKYQCAIEPVFFRTKRAEIDSLSEFNGQADGFREVTIRIPAEPFAYGLPVTGTATIANDPTAATNPMSYVFPDVQGDVETPLSLKIVAAGGTSAGGLIAMSSGPSSPSTPLITQAPYTTSAPTGWAYTAAYADAAAIGGTVSRLVKTSGTATAFVAVKLDNIPAGDYRLLARVKRVSGTGTVTVNGVQRRLGNSIAYKWLDFGVFRLPTFFPTTDIPTLSSTQSLGHDGIGVDVDIEATLGEVRVDAVMAVPAGLDDAQRTSILLGGDTGGLDGDITFVDSLHSKLLSWNSLDTGDVATLSLSVAGGFPALVPGAKNVLTLVRAFGDIGDDIISIPSALTFLYYPRYLYIRPATS